MIQTTITDQDIRSFWANVDRTESCWLWQASKNNKGYGRYCINAQVIYAHRFSYLLHTGILSDTLEVLHRCDNPACVNPTHLWLGTHQENMRDSVQKQRAALGEYNGMASMSNAQVTELRKDYATGNYLQRELAIKYSVSGATVSRIVNSKVYKDMLYIKKGLK